MPTRQRAWYQGRVVEIMSGDATKKTGNVRIRDIGFVKGVAARDVELMSDDDPAGATRTWESPKNMESASD